MAVSSGRHMQEESLFEEMLQVGIDGGIRSPPVLITVVTGVSGCAP